MLKRYLEIGKIVNTHGIKGNLKVEPWCNSADFLSSFDYLYLNEGQTKIKVVSSRSQKSIVILQLDGVDTIEKAESIKGAILYVDRDDVKLDKNEHFIQDIVGCNVFNYDSEELYGVVTDVFKTGSNDVYEVTNVNGKKYLVPVIDDVIKSIDIDNHIIKITPIKGIFNDGY